jgi:hypothetical protein
VRRDQREDERAAMLAGFVMLMMLMVTVMYNDLARISFFERFIPGGR